MPCVFSVSRQSFLSNSFHFGITFELYTSHCVSGIRFIFFSRIELTYLHQIVEDSLITNASYLTNDKTLSFVLYSLVDTYQLVTHEVIHMLPKCEFVFDGFSPVSNIDGKVRQNHCWLIWKLSLSNHRESEERFIQSRLNLNAPQKSSKFRIRSTRYWHCYCNQLHIRRRSLIDSK